MRDTGRSIQRAGRLRKTGVKQRVKILEDDVTRDLKPEESRRIQSDGIACPVGWRAEGGRCTGRDEWMHALTPITNTVSYWLEWMILMIVTVRRWRMSSSNGRLSRISTLSQHSRIIQMHSNSIMWNGIRTRFRDGRVQWWGRRLIIVGETLKRLSLTVFLTALVFFISHILTHYMSFDLLFCSSVSVVGLSFTLKFGCRLHRVREREWLTNDRIGKIQTFKYSR